MKKVLDAPSVDALKEAGFEKAAKDTQKKLDLRFRLMMAYEHYRFATQECIDRFNVELKKKSEKIMRDGKRVKNIDYSKWQEVSHDKLRFRDIKEFPDVPPQHVVDSLNTAKERKIFDRFEVCDIETVVKREDPILFGRIEGCPDRFMIDQWDDDVRFEQIVRATEG